MVFGETVMCHCLRAPGTSLDDDPSSGWFHESHFIAAILLHGEDAMASISLSNFRVMCAFYENGIAQTYALSPSTGRR
jgi:hypothetical protein